MVDLPAPGLRPVDSISAAARRFGEDEVREWCAALVCGDEDDLSPGRPSISWLGGTVGWPEYWTRVWGARGLLHLGVPASGPSGSGAALIRGLSDPAWRVREMSLKVIARHGLEDSEIPVGALLDDPVERVRIQARRALDTPREPS